MTLPLSEFLPPADMNQWRIVLGALELKTLEGWLSASVGDFIIREISGEYSACKPDIFWATYEIVKHPKKEPEDGKDPTGT